MRLKHWQPWQNEIDFILSVALQKYYMYYIHKTKYVNTRPTNTHDNIILLHLKKPYHH